MRTTQTLATGALAMLLAGATSISAAPLPKSAPAGTDSLVQNVHNVYEARRSLRARGFYNIEIERASLPYSFIACRRSTRYHVHVGYYGEIQELDPIGRCGYYGYGYGRRDLYGDGSSYAPRYRRYRDQYDY